MFVSQFGVAEHIKNISRCIEDSPEAIWRPKKCMLLNFLLKMIKIEIPWEEEISIKKTFPSKISFFNFVWKSFLKYTEIILMTSIQVLSMFCD